MAGFSPTILSFDRIDSTNAYLKRHYPFLKDHTFVSAGYQAKGKGQFNRVWESEADKNLLCSLLLKEEFPNEALIRFATQSVISFLASLEIEALIKPPNDIYCNGRKLAGILIEQLFAGNNHEATIIGFGINVNQDAFQTPNAISLANLTGKHYDLSILTSRLVEIIGMRYPPK